MIQQQREAANYRLARSRRRRRRREMSDPSLDLAARAVLDQYGLSNALLSPLGNRGGCSGASLWRVRESGGDWCLRAWPQAEVDRQRITHIHFSMKVARDKGLSFVPNVLITSTGATTQVHVDRIWDICTWMPG